jgi:hypothetical protein
MAERRDFLRNVAAAGTGAFALPMIVTDRRVTATRSPVGATLGPPSTADTGTTRAGTTGNGPGT